MCKRFAQHAADVLQSKHTRSALCSWTLFMACYHVACALFEHLDRTQKLQQYKQFRWKKGLPTYRDMLPRVLANQTLIMLPCMIAVWPLTNSYSGKQPSTPTSLLALAALAPLLHELPFYALHRWVLHSPHGVPRLGHSLHHNAKAHSAVSAMYMYAFDYVLQIVVPYVIPLLVLRATRMLTASHAVALLPLGSLGGLYEHSGYIV